MLLQQLINALELGAIYSLIALGYTMVYGIIRLINFAHGELYMVGAYIAYFVAGATAGSFLPTLIVPMALTPVLALVIERLAYRPLRYAPRLAALSTALGVSIFLQNFVRQFIGASFRPFPQIMQSKTYEVGGMFIRNKAIVVVVVAVALMVALQVFVRKTRIGKAMRAVSYDKDAARLMGIDIDFIISITFVIGSSLAAAAGVLVGLAYPRIDPMMGFLPGLKAFVAAVLGGIGSIPGAMLGGLLMGLAETMVVHVGMSTWRDAVAFAILILVLLVRPTGLMGQRAAEKV